MLLGELVAVDRQRHGWTQEELADRLNKVPPGRRPPDPVTGKPKQVHRTWVNKLEQGGLKRDLSASVREWLGDVLGGDKVLYQQLSITAKASAPDDVAQEQLDFLRAVLEKFPVRSQVLVDVPAVGPLSSQRPHFLLLLAGVITIHDSELIIFSNEHPPINTRYCVMLLHLILGVLSERVEDQKNLRKYLVELEWDELDAVVKKVVHSTKRGDHPTPVVMRPDLQTWLKEHLVIYERRSPIDPQERYNPLTLVAVEGTGGRAAFAIDGSHNPWEIRDHHALLRAFDLRRPSFERRPFDPEGVRSIAADFGFQLRFE